MKNIKLTQKLTLKDLLKEILKDGVKEKSFQRGYNIMKRKLKKYIEMIED